MTGYPEFNYPAFHQGRDMLLAVGFEVFSPADIEAEEGWEWIDYMGPCIDAVFRADGIATLPGYELSKGAQIECRIAVARGIPVQPLDYWLYR